MARRPPSTLPVLAAVTLPLLLGCSDEQAAGEAPDATLPDGPPVAHETVARGLTVPWDLDFAPDGRIFVTERPGRIRVIAGDSLVAEPWAELDVAEVGEAGLMGLALAPDFTETGHVYVAGTFRTAGGRLVDRVIRFTERGGRGTAPEVIVDGLPAARFHAGSAVDFGPDGMLYVTTGDARDPGAAQNPRALNGKLLRYTPTGGIPSDNPVPGSPVFAYGLRNPQGLAWHPATGDLFATDHGPSGLPREGFRRGRDELNVIRASANYGWPEAAGREQSRAFVPPVAVWTPAIAPSGLAVYDGPHTPWVGDAFVGALRGRQLRRVVLERDPGAPGGWRTARQEVLLPDELGRIRAVAAGPDGHLYITTSNRDGRGEAAPADDRVIRVLPLRPSGG